MTFKWLNDKKCSSCVFGGLEGYGNPHEHRVVKESLEKGVHVKCHKTGLVCKGFDENYPMRSQIQQVMTRLKEIYKNE